jgi:hypothetical protein
MFEPALHVAERILVGDQLDESLFAVGIEAADFLARHRGGVAPDFFVAGVGEGVLGVELKLVDFEFGKPIDDLKERGHRRDFVAADVEQNAPDGKIGGIGDLQTGKRLAIGAVELGEGLAGVEKGLLIAADDGEMIGSGRNGVTLGRHIRFGGELWLVGAGSGAALELPRMGQKRDRSVVGH